MKWEKFFLKMAESWDEVRRDEIVDFTYGEWLFMEYLYKFKDVHDFTSRMHMIRDAMFRHLRDRVVDAEAEIGFKQKHMLELINFIEEYF